MIDVHLNIHMAFDVFNALIDAIHLEFNLNKYYF